jgi:hypothetical protein
MRIFVASLIVLSVLYFWDKDYNSGTYWMGWTACDEPSPIVCFIEYPDQNRHLPGAVLRWRFQN